MIKFDASGFLVDQHAWSTEIAEDIAKRESIDLTDDHWKVIWAVRRFYASTGVSPSMRPLVKIVRNEVRSELASSLAMHELFPGQPSRMVAMIGGLPKPSDCL